MLEVEVEVEVDDVVVGFHSAANTTRETLQKTRPQTAGSIGQYRGSVRDLQLLTSIPSVRTPAAECQSAWRQFQIGDLRCGPWAERTSLRKPAKLRRKDVVARNPSCLQKLAVIIARTNITVPTAQKSREPTYGSSKHAASDDEFFGRQDLFFSGVQPRATGVSREGGRA